MSARAVQILRLVIVVLVVAIVGFAAATVRHIVSADPSTPKTELDRAVFAAEEAVKANPDDPTARVKLAAAYLERNNTRGALEQSRFAVRLAPKEPAAYYVLGMSLAAQGDHDEAIKQLTKAADTKGQMAPFYQDVNVALAREYEAIGNSKKAIVAMSKALNYGPENVVLLVERAQMNERAKDWMNAMDDYAAALEYMPQHEEARKAFNKLKKDHPAEYNKLVKLYGAPIGSTETTGKK